MEEQITIDFILAYLEDAVRTHKPLAPSAWIDAAQKMSLLLGDEEDLLHSNQQQVAALKLAYLDEDPKRNVSAARARVEASDECRKMRDQASKVKRIQEQIRIAKVQGRMRMDEMRGF